MDCQVEWLDEEEAKRRRGCLWRNDRDKGKNERESVGENCWSRIGERRSRYCAVEASVEEREREREWQKEPETPEVEVKNPTRN